MTRKRILFVPHCPCDSHGWEGSRPYHLCRQLAKLHELHVVTWEQSRRPRWGKSFGAYQTEATSGDTRYKMWLLPNLYRLVTRDYPRQHHLILNQLLFRSTIKRLCKHVQPDVLIYAGSHHFTGYPPFRMSIPTVFDYVDKSPPSVEAAYVRGADAVVAVSNDYVFWLQIACAIPVAWAFYWLFERPFLQSRRRVLKGEASSPPPATSRPLRRKWWQRMHVLAASRISRENNVLGPNQ